MWLADAIAVPALSNPPIPKPTGVCLLVWRAFNHMNMVIASDHVDSAVDAVCNYMDAIIQDIEQHAAQALGCCSHVHSAAHQPCPAKVCYNAVV